MALRAAAACSSRREQKIRSIPCKEWRQLTAIVDGVLAEGLAGRVLQGQRWPDARRLRELTDPECDHEWLWATDPNKGKILGARDYVDAVRLRLGAAGPDEPTV
eukprot:12421015-Karenia_brevis.AAC.1